MSKFYVVQGRVQVSKGDPASVGDTVELTAEQAAPLLLSGVIAEEAKYASLKKQAEGAVESGAELEKLSKPVRNLAGLIPVATVKKAEPKAEVPTGKASTK